MNVKKIVTLIVLAAFGISSQAQVVSSESENLFVIKTKKPKTTLFYVKAGVGVDFVHQEYDYNNSHIDDDFTPVAFEVALGLKKNFKNKKTFWGAEIGGVSTSYDDETYGSDGKYYKEKNDLLVFANPYVGVDLKMGETTTISPFIGPSIGLGVSSGDGFYGVAAGANIWFNKKYAIGLDYKYNHDSNKPDKYEKYWMHSLLLTGIIKL